MPQVHPTSLIDPLVELAPDVQIGPWCHLQGKIKIGAGTRLLERVTLRGPMVIGENNIIFPNVCIGLAPQDKKYDPDHGGVGIILGDRNIFREGVTIHRATGETPTTVGNDNFLMCNAHLAHDVVIGNNCTLVNGCLCAGHVKVDDKVTLGGNAGIHQFCRIGRLAMVSGVIGITQDIPPFCTAYNARRIGSLNRIGLRRAGYQAHIVPLSQAFDIYFRQGLSSPNAVEAILEEVGHDPLCIEFANFIKGTKRGITGYSDSGMAYEDYSGN